MSIIQKCKECGCFIDLELGQYEPSQFSDRDGSLELPRSPGDSDDFCDVCDYS